MNILSSVTWIYIVLWDYSKSYQLSYWVYIFQQYGHSVLCSDVLILDVTIQDQPSSNWWVSKSVHLQSPCIDIIFLKIGFRQLNDVQNFLKNLYSIFCFYHTSFFDWRMTVQSVRAALSVGSETYARSESVRDWAAQRVKSRNANTKW